MTCLKLFWNTWQLKINDFESKKDWWEVTKLNTKELCLEVGKKHIKETNIKFSKLQKGLNKVGHENPINTAEINRLNNMY